MSEHTKGPWRVEHEVTGLAGIVALGQNMEGREFYIRADHHVPDTDLPGNAALIAAAPDLLSACERMMGLDDTCDEREPGQDSDPDDCPSIAENGIACHWCFMRAAIRKARGTDTEPEGE